VMSAMVTVAVGQALALFGRGSAGGEKVRGLVAGPAVRGCDGENGSEVVRDGDGVVGAMMEIEMRRWFGDTGGVSWSEAWKTTLMLVQTSSPDTASG
jgi:hypothetical protein